MSAVQPFDFQGQQVRTVLVDGEPWFVALDVAKILGYDHAPSMVRTLDSDEKGVRPMHTLGGDQSVAVISEGGLFRCIVQRQTGRMADDATREQVKVFQRWVTHDVLPAIRQTGSYGAPRELTFEEMVQKTLTESVARIEALQGRVAELEPAANAWDDLASAAGDYSVGDAAKVLCRAGIATGQNRLFATLNDLGWTFRRSGDWQAMQSAVDSGLVVERLRPPRYDQVTGEQVAVAPQIRITAKGIERLRTSLGGTAVIHAVPS